MTKVALSESLIRAQTSEDIFDRGQAYARSGAVVGVVQHGDVIVAQVSGSDYDPYQVFLQTRDGALSLSRCSCPYDWGGWCKHLVAVGLVAIQNPEKVESMVTVPDLVADLSKSDLVQLLTELVIESPKLFSRVEYFVKNMDAALSSPTAQNGESVDMSLIRDRVAAGLRADLDLGHVIGVEMDLALDLAYAGLAEPVIQIFTMLTEMVMQQLRRSLEEAMHSNDWDDRDYGYWGDPYEEGLTIAELNALSEINTCWSEACLALLALDALSPHDAQTIQEAVARWESEISVEVNAIVDMGFYLDNYEEGAEVLYLIGPASEADWSEPLWQPDPEDDWYYTELNTLRLQVLERLERYDAYLKLAEEVGNTVLWVGMLAKLGRTTEAETLALTEATSPGIALTLAQTLYRRGATSVALRVAEQGLEVDSTDDPYAGFSLTNLGRWLTDIAHQAGNAELAIKAAVITLLHAPDLANFEKLRAVAGEQWPLLNADVLDRLRHLDPGQGAGLCEIFLAEGLVQDAIHAASNYMPTALDKRLLTAAIPVDPNWVINRAGGRAAGIMNAGKASHYDEAVAWLRYVRDAYASAGQTDVWRDHLAHIRDVHGRKYKLIGLLKTFDQ